MKYKYLRFAYNPQATDRTGGWYCKAEAEVVMRRGPEFDKQLGVYLRRDIRDVQDIRASELRKLTQKLTR